MRKTDMDSVKILLIVAGTLSILLGVIPVAGTLLLGNFGYPEIIRESPEVILESLHAARATVPYLYYVGIGGAGLCMFFLVILLSRIFNLAGDETWGRLAKYCGIVDGLCLYGGIIRWTFLFPALARLRAERTYDPKTVDLVFTAFNTYVGDSIAEHVGFTFMFFWLLFINIAILKTKIASKWIGIAGLAFSAVVLYGNLEFFGAPGAFLANRTGIDLVALWAVALGINLIMVRNKGLSGEGRGLNGPSSLDAAH